MGLLTRNRYDTGNPAEMELDNATTEETPQDVARTTPSTRTMIGVLVVALLAVTWIAFNLLRYDLERVETMFVIHDRWRHTVCFMFIDDGKATRRCFDVRAS